MSIVEYTDKAQEKKFSESDHAGSILTYTGRFHPLSPVPSEVNILDIAHHTCQLVRYMGAGCRPYTVGEHQIHMFDYLREQNADLSTLTTALVHDGGEAYMHDMAAPIKYDSSNPIGEDYREIERKIDIAIAERFDLLYPFPKIIKETDIRIRVDEMAALFPDREYDEWGEGLGTKIKFWSFNRAKNEYLSRAYTVGLIDWSVYCHEVEKGRE